jgi:hypothetical protein
VRPIPDRARIGSAIAAFVGLRGLAGLLLLLLARLLRGLLLLLLSGLTLAGLTLLELFVGLGVVLEADVLALLRLELHAAIAFGLVSSALRLRLLVFALRLLPRVLRLARLLLLLLAGILLSRVLLLTWVLLLLLPGVLLAFVPGLIGHGVLLSIRDGAGERLTLGRAVYPVR